MLRRGTVALWQAISIFALGAGLSVDSLSPDALCPQQEETRRAVAARLGSVELEGTWRATYMLVHREQGNFLSLKLLDPDGVLRLERQLPVRAGSCAALSDVIALVLERFFLKPEQLPPHEDAPSLAEPGAHASKTSGPAAAGQASAQPDEQPVPQGALAIRSPTNDETRRFRAAAGLWATTSWLAPTLRVDSVIARSYRVGVSAGFDLRDHETDASEGSVVMRRMPLALSAARDFSAGSLAMLNAGIELVGVVEAAHTTSLAKPGSGLRLVPGLGARLGLWFFPETAAAPFVELTGAYLLRAAAPAFLVGEREVLRPKSLVLGLNFGISTPF